MRTSALEFLFDNVAGCMKVVFIFRGCLYGGELTRLGGLACLGEMIFNSLSYGIFCPSSIKKFVMSLEKGCLIKQFFQ